MLFYTKRSLNAQDLHVIVFKRFKMELWILMMILIALYIVYNVSFLFWDYVFTQRELKNAAIRHKVGLCSRNLMLIETETEKRTCIGRQL